MPPNIKRMNKGAYLAFFITMLILNIAAIVIVSVIMYREQKLAYVYVGLVAGSLLIMIASVGLAVFHYRMWAAIYEKDMKVGGVKIDPVIAVALLFVSFVGEYWTFRFYTEFIYHYNENVKKYGGELQLLPTGESAYTAIAKLRVAALIIGIITIAIPFVLPLLWLLILVMYFIFFGLVSKTCDAVNFLADAVERGS